MAAGSGLAAQTERGSGEIKLEGSLEAPNPGVRVIIFQADVRGHRLQLVEYLDGAYAIFRDGRSIEARAWRAAELDHCIATFRRLCHEPEVREKS